MLYQLSYFRNRFPKGRAGRIPTCPPLSAYWWAEMDSNHRSRKTADLQSAPFGHSGIRPYDEELLPPLARRFRLVPKETSEIPARRKH